MIKRNEIFNKEQSKLRKFVNVFDINKAEELKNLGFNYITQTMNGETIYVFPDSDKLFKLLKKQFSKKDYQYTTSLKF